MNIVLTVRLTTTIEQQQQNRDKTRPCKWLVPRNVGSDASVRPWPLTWAAKMLYNYSAALQSSEAWLKPNKWQPQACIDQGLWVTKTHTLWFTFFQHFFGKQRGMGHVTDRVRPSVLTLHESLITREHTHHQYQNVSSMESLKFTLAP